MMPQTAFRYYIFIPCWVLFCLESNKINAEIKSKLFDAETTSDQGNFMRVVTNAEIGKEYDELTYCFRWLLKYTNTQCLFWEPDIGFTFSHPIKGFGFIMINGLNFMYRFQNGIEIVPYTWNNICVSYQAKSNHVTMLLNGDTVLDNSYAVLSNLTSKSIILEKELELGNCRYLDSTDLSKKIARVKLQDFNMWSTALSKSTLLEFTSKCESPYTISSSFSILPDIVNWNTLNVKEQGKMVLDKRASQKSVLCGGQEEGTTLMIPVRMTYSSARLTCAQLGGLMTYPTDKIMLSDINSDYRESNTYPEMAIRNRYKGAKSTKDNDQISTVCNKHFWIPITQQEKSSNEITWWSDTGASKAQMSFLPWELGQPNGLSLEKCIHLKLDNQTYSDIDCDDLVCHLCTFQNTQVYTIRGLGSDTGLIRYDEREFWIDRTYIFLPAKIKNAKSLSFLGYSESKIKWNFETNTWSIEDKKKNELAFPQSQGSNLPIGKHIWRFKLSNDTTDEIDLEMKLTKVCMA